MTPKQQLTAWTLFAGAVACGAPGERGQAIAMGADGVGDATGSGPPGAATDGGPETSSAGASTGAPATDGDSTGGGSDEGDPVEPEGPHGPDCDPAPAGVLTAFPCAEGFGALATGGRGGDVFHVTTLSDAGAGSLREGITTADGPRTIVFETGGEIRLESPLVIDRDNLTIAGQTAPGDGITIRDRSVEVRNAEDIVVRFVRIRRGNADILAGGTPSGSAGLDTVSIDDSRNVIFDHVSLSWSCDEVFGVVQNEGVTLQRLIVSEPLGGEGLHPYSDNHAYGLNDSASTLSVHHTLIANYVMRGPQFEANDASNGQGYDVQMEAVNNVMYDYERSGSRYTSGIEDNAAAASAIEFLFHFRANTFIRDPAQGPGPEIRTITKHGVTDQVRVHVQGNIGPNRPADDGDEWAIVWTGLSADEVITSADSDLRAQMADAPLFLAPVPVSEDTAAASYERVLEGAGASKIRDAVDARIVDDVVSRQYADPLFSPEDVGGFPPLQPGAPVADVDRDGMADAWERAHGLDPSDPDDRNDDRNGDGWTNLEEYLEFAAFG
ncbi:MAG: pectate lyase [Myxococcota bacterium]